MVNRMIGAMSSLAEVYGGTASPLDTKNEFQRIISAHPLERCPPSETPKYDVVSLDGQVQKIHESNCNLLRFIHVIGLARYISQNF